MEISVKLGYNKNTLLNALISNFTINFQHKSIFYANFDRIAILTLK